MNPGEGTLDSVTNAVEQWQATYGAAEGSVADFLCDRHDPAAVAFTFIAEDLSTTDLTYGELAQRSRKLATVLFDAGVERGTRVPVLMGKRPELVITLLALWRLGAVHVPLFTAFATGAIQLRVTGAQARLIITEPSQRAKLDPIPDVTVIEIESALRDAEAADPLDTAVRVGPEGTFLQLYTSGTTGKPKGVPVPARALAGFHSYLHFALDVRPDDVFWNAADPGWAYGLYYALVAPMAAGRRSLLTEFGFTPESTAQVLRTFGVTNFAGAPTMYRAMAQSPAFPQGDTPPKPTPELSLRCASSAGEPLTPDVVSWATQNLGTEVRDHYGQTELGMVIGNAWHPDLMQSLLPGSMGKPLPGHQAGIVDGVIAVNVVDSPLLWFTGYDQAPEQTEARFTSKGEWYLTGDTGRVDDDGNYFFTARDDDLILAAGYRIGPFDVESVVITHPAVADVAVVGLPDPEGIRGQIVVAFVITTEGTPGSPELISELQALVRDNYSKHAYPRQIRFVDSLPKTPSGKVQRYLLRD